MENTVTISVKEFDQLRNGFKCSKEKIRLDNLVRKMHDNLIKRDKLLQEILKEDFVKVEFPVYRYNFSITSYYFKKDKTPIWIKKFFNK